MGRYGNPDTLKKYGALFDAVRDNNGKGIPAQELISALEKKLSKKKHGRTR